MSTTENKIRTEFLAEDSGTAQDYKEQNFWRGEGWYAYVTVRNLPTIYGPRATEQEAESAARTALEEPQQS